MDKAIQATIRQAVSAHGNITILTGAGISAESGIPTFRGPEGYWTIGAREYHPQEMATHAMFTDYPDEVWQWYLYRLTICRAARPNSGHLALVEMEDFLKDRFTLVTQNVDGLHLQAGNSLERTMQIHGNIGFMRCSVECSQQVYPVPDGIKGKGRGEPLNDDDQRLLCCPACGAMSRPHVLWFDESYNEHHYHYFSAMEAARQTSLLIIIGTSGATSLPVQIAAQVNDQGGTIINIDTTENPFGSLAMDGNRGFFLQGESGSLLPKLTKVMGVSGGT